MSTFGNGGNHRIREFNTLSPLSAKQLHDQQEFEFRMGCPAYYVTGSPPGLVMHGRSVLAYPPPRPHDPAYGISAFQSRYSLELARASIEGPPQPALPPEPGPLEEVAAAARDEKGRRRR